MKKSDFELCKINIEKLKLNEKQKIVKKLLKLGFIREYENVFDLEEVNYIYIHNLFIAYGQLEYFFIINHYKEISPSNLFTKFKHKLK